MKKNRQPDIKQQNINKNPKPPSKTPTMRKNEIKKLSKQMHEAKRSTIANNAQIEKNTSQTQIQTVKEEKQYK